MNDGCGRFEAVAAAALPIGCRGRAGDRLHRSTPVGDVNDRSEHRLDCFGSHSDSRLVSRSWSRQFGHHWLATPLLEADGL